MQPKEQARIDMKVEIVPRIPDGVHTMIEIPYNLADNLADGQVY
jgi:hypothetical protein